MPLDVANGAIGFAFLAGALVFLIAQVFLRGLVAIAWWIADRPRRRGRT